MNKILIGFLIFISIFILFLISFFFISYPSKQKEIIWGINFSQKHAKDLGLNWKENYSSLLDDLGFKNIKILTHWDLIESEKDKYVFDDLDWQINEAEKRGVGIILVIGMKTGRWPECHIPEWAKKISKQEQQKEILELLEKIVLRYRNRISINVWQVENEPFFPFFGECPWMENKKFLKKEIDLVKSLDDASNKKPIMITDSGEWFLILRPDIIFLGEDMIGITLYRKIWSRVLRIYHDIPLFPAFYGNRALLVKKLFNKKVIVAELQAEPWGKKLLYDSPIEEQKITMDFKQFKKNIEFAKQTGIDTFYLWGGEWWYWMKDKQNDSSFWDEIKNLLKIKE